ADLIARHPELAPDLAGFFADRERFRRLTEPLRPVAQAAQADASTRHGGAPASTPTITVGPGGAETEGPAAAPPPIDGDADPLPRGTTVRYFGDYELQKVLGRGGVGVVYKAKQRSLNRLVAVKMIREGVWAGDDEIRRFRNEAEAVAALDHPQIVPI